jgi:hypothetical protein
MSFILLLNIRFMASLLRTVRRSNIWLLVAISPISIDVVLTTAAVPVDIFLDRLYESFAIARIEHT